MYRLIVLQSNALNHQLIFCSSSITRLLIFVTTNTSEVLFAQFIAHDMIRTMAHNSSDPVEVIQVPSPAGETHFDGPTIPFKRMT